MKKMIEYQDPVTEIRGWLAYDGTSFQLAAGGCRVQRGLDAGHISTLASRMRLKQRVLGLNVAGAKCGIDLDPLSDRKPAALAGFIEFLRDELCARFSMGPDMGTEWSELHRCAARVGIPSIKYAIRAAQGLTEDEFFTRIDRLDDRCGAFTLGQRRAGHALAHATIAAARATGMTGSITVALQGFGNLGRAAMATLAEEGVLLIAVADENGTVNSPSSLDAVDMLNSPLRTPVTQIAVDGRRTAPQAIFDVPADVLVLAGGADAMDQTQTAVSPFRVVAVGANCGLSQKAEVALDTRGVLVVPDIIGGIGGSASMEALFGPQRAPSAQQVLDTLARMIRDLVDDIASISRRRNVIPRDAAMLIAAKNTVDPAAPPYGTSRYLTARTA
jgi:glutamate dehydrogenase (NAD(P)+)